MGGGGNLIKLERLKSMYFSKRQTVKLSRTELNMGSRSPNFFNISIFLWVRFDRTKLCFNAFEWFTWWIQWIWMIFISSVRSNRTRKNIEILKKFDSLRLNSVRFDSVRYSRKVLEFHYICLKLFSKHPLEDFQYTS